MSPCPGGCGAERTRSGYCSAQGQQAVCALRAELRDVKAERDRLRTAIRINADELRDVRKSRQDADAEASIARQDSYLVNKQMRDLRAAVLAVAERMDARGQVLMQYALVDYADELREVVGK